MRCTINSSAKIGGEDGTKATIVGEDRTKPWENTTVLRVVTAPIIFIAAMVEFICVVYLVCIATDYIST